MSQTKKLIRFDIFYAPERYVVISTYLIDDSDDANCVNKKVEQETDILTLPEEVADFCKEKILQNLKR